MSRDTPIASSDKPVSAIARKCGFSSAEVLRQTFVAHFGLPPSRYRAAHRSAPAPTSATSDGVLPR